MRIAVNGATGYTGELAAAELARRGIASVLIGRDEDRLRRTRAEAEADRAEIRVAEIADADTLLSAFDGCDAVINCAGPFTVLGEPVIRAAVAAGCHYVDTAGEQHHVKRVFDRFTDEAETAGVTVVPGLADDGGPGDMLGHLTGTAVSPAAELTVGLWYRGGGASRGSLRSMLTVLGQEALDYVDGRWVPSTSSPRAAMRFPGADARVPVAKFGIPPVVTVPRHVQVGRVEGFVNADLVDRLRAVTPELVESLPPGPSAGERRLQRWTHVSEAVGVDGRTARGELEGSDGYAMTAVIAVEGAHRLATADALRGVLAPAQAFDPADFLNWLAPYGVRWHVEVR